MISYRTSNFWKFCNLSLEIEAVVRLRKNSLSTKTLTREPKFFLRADLQPPHYRDISCILNFSPFTLPLYLQAANYLDIKGLLDVTCKTVANMIKGKSPEEIRPHIQHQERLYARGGRAGEHTWRNCCFGGLVR